MLPTRDPSQDERLTQTESEGVETNFQANGQKKKAGVAILISDKIDFQRRAINRDPEGHFIILKGRIHQKDINILNIYAPNIGRPKYIKKILEPATQLLEGTLTPHCQKWTDLPNKISRRILCDLTIP